MALIVGVDTNLTIIKLSPNFPGRISNFHILYAAGPNIKVARKFCPHRKLVEYKRKSLSSPHDCADHCPIDVIVEGHQFKDECVASGTCSYF
ncbi:unnamed protein product [Prunus armeniaca]|uniref:Uncharacterized protein n=1 Tax=Prunus armeniaca TaxID=36596 RepID=A0A6J5V321_PRUAR|nr:unnamed protein product [Prunus armeniaca]CAB4312645.1 unnamed protein product [Prunus armeniaca]